MRSQTATRTFWWDRTSDADVDPLRAVIFDLDEAVADIDDDGEFAPRAGLLDLVMSLFVAGVWVGVVSTGRRAEVEPLVRELLGDGLVETIVTSDDADSTDPADLYELALWEFGVDPESALAVVGTPAGWCAAGGAGIAVVAPTDDISDFATASGCQRRHRRWWTAQRRAAA